MPSLDAFLPEVIQEIYDVPDGVALNAIRNAIIDFCRQSTYVREEISILPVSGTSTYTLTPSASNSIVHTYDGRLEVIEDSVEAKTPQQLRAINYRWRDETGPRARYYTRETTTSARITPYPPAATSGNTITTIDNTTPINIVDTGHGLSTGDAVSIHGTGVSSIDDAGFRVTKVDADNYTLDGTTAGGADTGGYWIKQEEIIIPVAVQPTPTATTIDDDVYNNYHETIAHGALAKLHAMPNKTWTDYNAAAYHDALYTNGLDDATRRAEDDNMNITRVVRYGGI